VLIGSLFSGVGGLDLGLERALGWSVAWQVEQDDFCRRVLAKHWPKAERFDDVRTVGATQLARVDLICGGFPCQDVSGAGLGAGIREGTRSGLWIEFDRIVGELSPEWVVVENVALGQGKWLPQVRHDLLARGYETTAYALSAYDVGAPQLRRRVFVVAHANGDALRQRAEWFAGGRSRVPSPKDAKSVHARAHVWPARRGRPVVGPQPGVRRGADGVSRGLDKSRLRALGNAVVPQCAEVIGRIIAEMDEMRCEVAT
jgi:DNA (cytosine-5)-methyltransferase 1